MDARIQRLAERIDCASDAFDDLTLNDCINECEELSQADGYRGQRAVLFFYMANCFSALAARKMRTSGYRWSWDQKEKIEEILYLRKAVISEEFRNLDPLFQCKVYTNLGNCLNQFGRFIAAADSWRAALEVDSRFAMALGNRGVGLIEYARTLYDDGHIGVMFAHAKADLYKAVSKGVLWDSGEHPEALKHFQEYYDYADQALIDAEYDWDFDLNQWPLGDSEEETNYREWCLRNRLFLSPINDVCTLSAAAQDVLHLPSHCYKVDEGPRFPKYFNVLKQEYVTARYLLFDSESSLDEHYSDRNVLLLSGYDGAYFGYRNEQAKTAYRLAYSIFDKIAIFINDYFNIGLKPRSVTFRKIWGSKEKGGEFKLRECFHNLENWPLRGLYFLSKDLFDDEFSDVSLPDSQELDKLRNLCEHRFVSIQEYDALEPNTENHEYITIDDLRLKTTRILSIAREALVYLSLAMHIEEFERKKQRNSVTMPIYSHPIDRSFSDL